jgi:hypothetical protein
VVDGHISWFCTTVLARVIVTGENLVTRHLPALDRPTHHVNEPDNVWSIENIIDCVDVFAAI